MAGMADALPVASPTPGNPSQVEENAPAQPAAPSARATKIAAFRAGVAKASSATDPTPVAEPPAPKSDEKPVEKPADPPPDAATAKAGGIYRGPPRHHHTHQCPFIFAGPLSSTW
jgi:hypothetical protein